MKRILSSFCSALLCLNVFAYDIITLKNGQIIKGEVYTTLDNGDLGVRKLDGNYVLVPNADILSRTQTDKETTSSSAQPVVFDPSNLGIKLSYAHGFNSTVEDLSLGYDGYYDELLYTSSTLKNGNGLNFGISYIINLSRYFFFEPGVNLTYLQYTNICDFEYATNHYSLYYDDYSGHSVGSFQRNVNFIGWSIPLQLGLQLRINESYDWEFRIGPSISMDWNLWAEDSPRPFYKSVLYDDSFNRFKIGIQADTGIKIKQHNYIGIGFNLCCVQQGRSPYYIQDAKRNSLNVTYGHYF